MKPNCSIFFVLIFSVCEVNAQVYPFSLAGEITATLHVNLDTSEPFKNPLLGYNMEYFKSETEKDFVRRFNPVSMRFPTGVWSNFYHWRSDGYQNDSWDNGSHEAALEIYVDKVKGDIDHLAILNSEKKENYGRGFHMMWTYSMNFDDAESCVARAEKDLALGFEVKDIELGNEHFWKTQRSNQTATEADYLNRARSVANALHEKFPDVRISIPLGWRRTQENYNKAIIDDKEYYDAVSVHKYMGADPDVPDESNKAYSLLLTSRNELDEDVRWIRNQAGEKPIWLTEWGVSATKDVEEDAAAFLAMADVYLYLSENQDIYDRANWFIFNKAVNPMVVVDDKRRPVYPLQKRGYLMVYEIIEHVFLGADMLESSITSTQLTNNMNAVNARIVEKDGVRKVIAVNLANKPANFKVRFNGYAAYDQLFTHHALAFEQLGPVTNIGIDEDPKVLVKDGRGDMILPPLSVNVIKINEEPLLIPLATQLASAWLVYPNPSSNGVFSIKQQESWNVFFSGKKVMEGNHTTIDLSSLSRGVYLLKTATCTEPLVFR